MPGSDSQHIGDLGQALARTALSKSGFFVGEITPDPGEDFLVEIDGRHAIAEGDFPLRALLQVKGIGQELSDFALDVSVGKIRRWSAQPLPVFVVGVSTVTERFSPAECRMLERVLEEQFQCLLEHRLIFRNTRDRFTPAMRDEMLRERETKLRQSLGSWAVVLRNER